MNNKEADFLFDIYHHPSTLQSDRIRGNAKLVAKLSSQGLITTYNSKEYGSRWLITVEGIHELSTPYYTEDN